MPKKRSALLTAAILTGLFWNSPGLTESSVLMNMEKAGESIVRIRVVGQGMVQENGLKLVRYSSFAAGILIHSSGLIVTNAHTIRGAGDTVHVHLSDGRTLSGKVLGIFPGEDLGFVQAVTAEPLPALALADSTRVGLGTAVYTIGTSEIRDRSFSQGKITAIGQERNPGGKTPVKVFRVNFSAYQGDSGSPILDREGRLLGILSARQNDRTRSSFAVPSAVIAGRLAELNSGQR